MQVEGIEGNLRQFFEVDRNLPRQGIWPDRADQLGVEPVAIDDQKQPVLITRLWFPDVDGAFERS